MLLYFEGFFLVRNNEVKIIFQKPVYSVSNSFHPLKPTKKTVSITPFEQNAVLLDSFSTQQAIQTDLISLELTDKTLIYRREGNKTLYSFSSCKIDHYKRLMFPLL
jgi:hypothetical protein